MKYQALYQTVKDVNIMEILNIILNISILRAVFPSAALSSLPWLILTIIRWAENRKGRKRRGTTRWNGKPVAIMMLYPEAPVSKRIGIAKGKFHDPEDFDAYDEEIATLLTGGDL